MKDAQNQETIVVKKTKDNNKKKKVPTLAEIGDFRPNWLTKPIGADFL